MADEVLRASLGEQAAFQLANVTKTAPQFGAITPRWLVRFLDWKPVRSGSIRSMKPRPSNRSAIARMSPRWLPPSSSISKSRANTG